MANKNLNVTEHAFRRDYGSFRSQLGDGMACVRFADGTSLDLTIRTGALQDSTTLTARLKRDEVEAYARMSHFEEGITYQAKGLIQPATVAQYLRAAHHFADRKAAAWFVGARWQRNNAGFYHAMSYKAPALAQKLENIADSQL